MGRFLRYEPCPKCRSNGRDNRGDNLAVYDNGKHCFSCGYHRSNSPHRVIDVNGGPLNVQKESLPLDFTREVPAAALKWLLQWGLPWSYWKETIGFSPYSSRLVFCIGKPMAFSIGRFIPELVQESGETSGSTNKRKWFVWGDCHKHAEIYGEGETIVLVEDHISAAKVGQTQEAVAIPLFGAVVHNPVLYYLMQEQKPVTLWLDKDQHGMVYHKAAKLQSIINQPVRVVVSDQDPKRYSINDLKDLIK
jgi:hypothetical protein